MNDKSGRKGFSRRAPPSVRDVSAAHAPSDLESYRWVTLLAQRYTNAIATTDSDNADIRQAMHSLPLASAVFQRLMLDLQHPESTEQIAVLGPTQSGKSTLVNCLLDTPAASVSALAGFTVHTQGYAERISELDLNVTASLMSPLQRTAAASLDSDELDHYVLESVITGPNSMLDGAIVWDTPDFDSIAANDYSLSVIKTIALADGCVLIVSKDKYGDKRVWDMLGLLILLGKPLVICINKVDAADRQVIESAFRTRCEADSIGPHQYELLLLAFVRDAQDSPGLLLDEPTRKSIIQALQHLRDRIDRKACHIHFPQLVETHEAQWLAPLLAQINAQAQWQSIVQSAIDAADETYTTGYLNDPDKYDTFNRALAELLTLLEIPGLASTLAHARNLVTWPARRLLGVGRQALGQTPTPITDSHGDIMDQEALVLARMFDDVVIKVQRHILESASSPWWQSLDASLRAALPAVRNKYAIDCKQARKAFQPEIEKAAARLYDQLNTQPTLLNTLRAARASADAAGIALAVKTGGLAPTDLILAPAMLSLTTLLTESALGRYLDTIKQQLKQQQRAHMRQQVLVASLQQGLLQALEQMSASDHLSAALEPELAQHIARYQHR